MSTRPPAVAGAFYPSEPDELTAVVDGFIAAGRQPCPVGPVGAVIVPHSSYPLSAAVAGAGFAMLAAGRGRIGRVVVIGPSHHGAFRGIVLPRARAFATPLGSLRVDEAARDSLADLGFVMENEPAHRREHAIEVELPFIQRALGAVTIVPLLVGDATMLEVAVVLGRLRRAPGTAIVVSSDLSHYRDYTTARADDTRTAIRLEQLDGERLGPEDACGYLAIAGLLEVAAEDDLVACRLALCNSGDTGGGRQRVVGFGAWALGRRAH